MCSARRGSKIGVITPFDYLSIHSGSVQRVKADLAALSSSDYEVELIFPSRNKQFPHNSAAKLTFVTYANVQHAGLLPEKARLLIDVHTQGFNPFLRSVLKKRCEEYSVIFPHHPSSAVVSHRVVEERIPLIYVAHDCKYGLISQVTRNPLICKYIYYMERYACKHATRILCVSESDMHNLQDIYGISPDKMRVLPNTVDTDSLSEGLSLYDKSEERRKLGIPDASFVLLFHGRMDYRPNVDALRFILDEIVPILHHSVPKFKIMVVGAQIPKWSLNYGNELISFHPDVPDMRKYLAIADAAIVPLRKGGGTRIKILEAFAAKLPVISTIKGMEGIKCTDERQILFADETGEDFVRKIEALAISETMGAKLVDSAYDLVMREYSVQAASKCLRQVINEVSK